MFSTERRYRVVKHGCITHLFFFVWRGSSFKGCLRGNLFELAVWRLSPGLKMTRATDPTPQSLALYVDVCMWEGTAEGGILWPLILWTFLTFLRSFLKSSRRFFFSFLSPKRARPSEKWLPRPLGPLLSPTHRAPVPAGIFLNRCSHLPGTTAKPAVITCVKTRVQGITEGNRAIYKLLADCFKRVW